MRKPRALHPGDQVRVVSPASPLEREQIENGVRFLEAQGYAVSIADHAFDADGSLAGSDDDRARDLQDAFDDPDVHCVFCSRGGYGCGRLMTRLDIDKMARSGKMFCGFSDVTTLHLALNHAGLATFHTPMLISLSVEREGWVYDSLAGLLAGESSAPSAAPTGETLVPGTAEGILTGGCLSLLADGIGTPDALETAGKIVLIEDVDEKPQRVDALLTHFLNLGLLQAAEGLVIGEMTRTDDILDSSKGEWPWRKIVEDRIGDLNVPSVVNFPFGHMKGMLSLPLGVQARLDANEGTLEILETPCAD